ncbi:MAG TPA: ABC transporter permease subunit [Ilumatobacter sp.]
MTVAVRPAAGVDTTAARRWAPWAAFVGGALVLQVAFASSSGFPAGLDTTFETPIDRAGRWMRANRLSHPLFTKFFTPLSNAIDVVISGIGDLLLWAPWFVVIASFTLLTARARQWGEAAVVGGALAYTGAIGLWEQSMQTLALMSASVLMAVVIGLPLGVWGALAPRVERIVRPLLDVMQTVPAFIYFLPLFMLFGIGNVPAAIATVIYALPPVVRLTTLGIRQVPNAAVEASEMFGATRGQTLVKVQLPMALRTIMTGLSQTVMMALGIVVLATLIGADGLGSPVLQSLNQRRTGRGIAAGLAIVAIAMVLDRVWRSLAERDPMRRLPRRTVLAAVGAVAVATVVGRVAGWVTFPDIWEPRLFDPIDDGVEWARDNLRWFTRPFSDFVVTKLYLPPRDFLIDDVAWPVLVLVAGFACWRIKNWQFGVFAVAALLAIGLTGMWALSLDTFVQVIISTVLSLALAIPIGVWAGRSRRVEAVLAPVLDAMQTVPSLVYIIPAVILFTVGVVPGIIATVVYAMVPGVRITALGIREVDAETIEASQTFGATPRQTLLGVRLPLAAPTIMAGVNQVIMMVLAMVIITGLVGGGALGFETVRALQRSLFGLGFEVGLALVLIAMILDRFTEAWGQRLEPPASN